MTERLSLHFTDAKLPLWKSHTRNLCKLNDQTVKDLPSMQETQVRSLGWEDP